MRTTFLVLHRYTQTQRFFCREILARSSNFRYFWDSKCKIFHVLLTQLVSSIFVFSYIISCYVSISIWSLREAAWRTALCLSSKDLVHIFRECKHCLQTHKHGRDSCVPLMFSPTLTYYINIFFYCFRCALHISVSPSFPSSSHSPSSSFCFPFLLTSITAIPITDTPWALTRCQALSNMLYKNIVISLTYS